MPTPAELTKISVQEFTKRFRNEMIPLSNTFAYFSAAPLSEEDVREHLEEPISALPQGVLAGFTSVFVFLVPFLERSGGEDYVTFDRPDPKERFWAGQFASGPTAIMVFGVKDRAVADYHYDFYHAIATLAANRMPAGAPEEFSELLAQEIREHVHGEVDDESWALKQALLQKPAPLRRDSKAFRSYARQAFIDTMTLYLHGICCDIDVETGPRQIPSRHLRKRLELLHQLYPPPRGFAVFPEELKS
jgi:hypothetical protein